MAELAHSATGDVAVGVMMEMHNALQARIKQRKESNTAGSRMKTRKSTRTRQRIIEAAREIIYERGSIDFQMSEVAERCNMSKGALYYYFKDRSQIVSVIDDSIGDDIINCLEEAVVHNDTTIKALKELCDAFSDALTKNTTGFSALLSEFFHKGYQMIDDVDSRYSQMIFFTNYLIEQGKDQGVIEKSLDSSLIANSVIGVFMFAAMSYLNDRGKMDREEFSRQLMHIILQGVSLKDVNVGRELQQNS